MLQKVLQNLFPPNKCEIEKSKNQNCLPKEFLHCVCVWEFDSSIIALSCHWANDSLGAYVTK